MKFHRHAAELVDCYEHLPGTAAELFITEGESAGKAVAKARNKSWQAVIPLQGKPRNAMQASRSEILKHDLYQKLISAIGIGWDDSIELNNARFERILLLMDPDADGIHIGTLLMLFFYRWLRPMLDAGRVYVVRPPLLQAENRSLGGIKLIYSIEQERKLDQFCQKQDIVNVNKIRYRGLASIPSSILHSSCIDPATRVSYPLSAEDAESAIKVFEQMRNF